MVVARERIHAVQSHATPADSTSATDPARAARRRSTMARLTTITRSSTYVLTTIAAALFVALCAAFGNGLLLGAPWNSARWLDSPLITYLLLALIVGAGLVQANRLPESGF